MLFNSSVFLQFFAAFLLLYHLCRSRLAARNALIVAASYVFYGWWDYRFVALLFLTSLLDYTVGLRVEAAATPGRRRAWAALSVAGNLGVLAFFKYCNFFMDSLIALLHELGFQANPWSLNVILPVGISFYTFQSMSYTIDVYRRQIPATRDLLSFLAYVSFFPQLVAGPIERARRLLPQFQSERVITPTHLREGLWLILWGLFKKVVVADNMAPLVEMVYEGTVASGPAVALGTLAFAIQIYGDFSGYSDIARGLARWLGFDLMVNFNLPYLARSPREFWRRWHISLSTWLRDYLYISLGGNRRGLWRTRWNLMVTMLLGGLWHGAAWHFVWWGAWHGLGLALTRGRSASSAQEAQAEAGSLLRRLLSWAATFLFVLYGWLLFRAESMEQAIALTRHLANPAVPVWIGSYLWALAAFAAPLLLIQCWQIRAGDLLAPAKASPWARGLLQGVLLLLIVTFWQKHAAPFIYFQF